MSRFHQWANQASFNAKSAKEKEFAKFLNEKLQEKLGAEFQYFGTIEAVFINKDSLLIIVNRGGSEVMRITYTLATKTLTASLGSPSPKQKEALKQSVDELMAKEAAQGGGKRKVKKSRKAKKTRARKTKSKRRITKKRN